MKFMKKIALSVLVLALTVPAFAQTEKPLKRSRLHSVETRITNAITDAGLLLNTPPMTDPKIDQGSTVFSYFAKPTYQIGLPGQHFATMVTPEGRLYTGAAELIFFTKDLKPIEQRLYTLLDGWIPCVQYQYQDRGLVYSVEAFQYWLGEDYSGAPVDFVRVSVKNPGSSKLVAGLAVGYKFGGGDHRPPQMRQGAFSPFWGYHFADNYAERDGKLVYYFDQAPTKKWGNDLGGSGRGKFRVLEDWRVNSIAQYRFDLGPGEEKFFTFKFPHYPQKTDPETVAKLAAADYDEYLGRLKKFWTAQINQGLTISLAEPKVLNASRAALAHNIMCQEYPKDGQIKQTVNRFQYNRFWLRDGSFFARMYTIWGRPADAEKVLRYFLQYQDQSGNFVSQKGQLDGYGQSLWAFGEYLKTYGDRKFAAEILPAVKKAIAWLEENTGKDEYGLMPSTAAMDNEWIIGRYTGHNIWALAGLDGAVTVAKSAGDDKAAADFSELRVSFAENLLKRISEAANLNHGIIPPGMDVPDGVDWGNLFEVYPENFMAPDDPLIVRTFDHYRKVHMKEGISTYHTALHLYVTERLSEMSIRQGRQEEALHDLYSMLTHTGSCHQGFEWSIFPYANRDYCSDTPVGQSCNFPPHGWYAALYNTLLRNMLIREAGNDLHLLSVVSPEWVRPGDELAVNNAPNYFGMVSYKATAQPDRLSISIQSEFRNAPARLIIHFPFFATVSKVVADGKSVEFEPGRVALNPGVKQVEIFWQLQDASGWSYQDFVGNYRNDYAERYYRQY